MPLAHNNPPSSVRSHCVLQFNKPRDSTTPPAEPRAGYLLCHMYFLYGSSQLKMFLASRPPWVACALTGSSMATVWANVAATEVRGER